MSHRRSTSDHVDAGPRSKPRAGLEDCQCRDSPVSPGPPAPGRRHRGHRPVLSPGTVPGPAPRRNSESESESESDSVRVDEEAWGTARRPGLQAARQPSVRCRGGSARARQSRSRLPGRRARASAAAAVTVMPPSHTGRLRHESRPGRDSLDSDSARTPGGGGRPDRGPDRAGPGRPGPPETGARVPRLNFTGST